MWPKKKKKKKKVGGGSLAYNRGEAVIDLVNGEIHWMFPKLSIKVLCIFWHRGETSTFSIRP